MNRESAPSYLAKTDNTHPLYSDAARQTQSKPCVATFLKTATAVRAHGDTKHLVTPEKGFTAVCYPERMTPPGISTIKGVSTEAVERRCEGETRPLKSPPSAMLATPSHEHGRLLYRPLQKETAHFVAKGTDDE